MTYFEVELIGGVRGILKVSVIEILLYIKTEEVLRREVIKLVNPEGVILGHPGVDRLRAR